MDWLEAAITVALSLAALAFFARAATRPPVAAAGGVVVLTLPRATRWFLLGGVALFGAMIAFALWPLALGEPTDEDLRLATIGAPILLVLLVGCFCEQRVRLLVDGDGIGGRTAFRGERHVAWRDVVEVRWSNGGQWFVLVDRHGTKLRVHRFLQGYHVVPAMLRQHVPESMWHDAIAAWERVVQEA